MPCPAGRRPRGAGAGHRPADLLGARAFLPFGAGDAYVESRVEMTLLAAGGGSLAEALNPLLPGGAGGGGVPLGAAFTFTDIDAANDYATTLGPVVSISSNGPLIAMPATAGGGSGSVELPLRLPLDVPSARERHELGVDVDGNGLDDLLEFWMLTSLADPLRLIVTEGSAGGPLEVTLRGTLTLLGRVGDAGGHTPFDAHLTAVPEPAAAALLAIGLVGLAGVRRSRRGQGRLI